MSTCKSCDWFIQRRKVKEFGETLPEYLACSDPKQPLRALDPLFTPCSRYLKKDIGFPVTKSDIIDLTVHLHHSTEKAILVSDDGDKKKAVWVPKSQIEIDEDQSKGSMITFACPEWLAKDKGLI